MGDGKKMREAEQRQREEQKVRVCKQLKQLEKQERQKQPLPVSQFCFIVYL